ncbi:MAG: TlpA family protein disulfide reductase [Proteobacteria bacterium]|nr:TlpA family protein disulfide reductase [Pseudomonadota bacterium]
MTAIAVLLLNLNLFSQVLKPGDLIPDLLLSNVINYNSEQLNLCDFKGKLLIIDFWGTGCTACLKAFPKIDSLQQLFKDKIQFVAVNSQSKDSTIRFFTKMRHLKKPSVPFITGDTILSNLFPHDYIPHHVWIDSTGTIRFITDGYNATAEHITDFLNGNVLSLAEKKYEVQSYFDSPMEAIGGNSKWLGYLHSYSLLLHCISGVTFSNSVTSTVEGNRPNKISQTCASISQLYEVAYSEGGKYDFSSPNTIIINSKEADKLKHPADLNKWDEWIKDYSYNYELVVPPADAKYLYKKMRQDLHRYFGYTAIVTKRKVKCAVLSISGDISRLKSRGGKSKSNLWVISGDSLKYIINEPLERLVTALSMKAKSEGFPMPFIDKTNYHQNIDMRLSAEAFDNFDFNKLKKELKSCGLLLEQKNQETMVLIISDHKISTR